MHKQNLHCSLLLANHNDGDFYQVAVLFIYLLLGGRQVARHQVKSPISMRNDIMEGAREASQVQQAQNTLHPPEICENSTKFRFNSNE